MTEQVRCRWVVRIGLRKVRTVSFQIGRVRAPPKNQKAQLDPVLELGTANTTTKPAAELHLMGSA
jgi:hypothetical protein